MDHIKHVRTRQTSAASSEARPHLTAGHSAARDRARHAKSEPTPESPRPKVRDHGQEHLRAGTYNVAGGNEGKAPNFKDRTSDVVARNLLSGNMDVVHLQEVAVDTKNARGQDYNGEIMRDVFAQTYGLKDEDIREFSVDAQGVKHEITDAASRAEALRSDHLVYEGGGHSMDLTKETFDSQGNPVAYQAPGSPIERADGVRDIHPITTYRASLDNGQEYNSVFGDSGAGSKGYGNAVILKPGLTFRDEAGRVIPESLQVRELGQDPEPWNKPAGQERRTALAVRFNTPGGQTATAISAHLSTQALSDNLKKDLLEKGYSEDQIADWKRQLPGLVGQSQREEMRELERFALGFGGERNVLIGADFNNPDPARLRPGFAFREGQPVEGIDHIFTSQDIPVHDQDWVKPGERTSDHDLSIIDVTL